MKNTAKNELYAIIMGSYGKLYSKAEMFVKLHVRTHELSGHHRGIRY